MPRHFETCRRLSSYFTSEFTGFMRVLKSGYHLLGQNHSWGELLMIIQMSDACRFGFRVATTALSWHGAIRSLVMLACLGSMVVFGQQAPSAGKTQQDSNQLLPRSGEPENRRKAGPESTNRGTGAANDVTLAPTGGPSGTNAAPNEVSRQQPVERGVTWIGLRNWTTIEVVLSFSVLVFGGLVFALQTRVILKMTSMWTPHSVIRFNGLTLVITGAILLVTAGYSDSQITPVMGLLGAIAGYLLGAAERSEGKRQDGGKVEGG